MELDTGREILLGEQSLNISSATTCSWKNKNPYVHALQLLSIKIPSQKKYGKNRKSIRISIGYLRKHKNSSTTVKTFLAPYAPGRFDAKWFNDVNNILCSFFQFNEFAVRSTPYRKIHKSMDTQFANVPYNVHLLDDNECVPTKDGQGPKKGFGQTPLFRLCLIFIFVTMMRKDEVFGENIMK